ncbi:hypothetical protein BN140_2360 [Methanoculleus bourgensis MS2]|jgi:ABC-type sugar transport system ATPase subunit|uniref:Uncharacterized protein n=1 Tax=Methanoculleus bourgensis (strain ATCC 43281 / DSM 3045 / OCM 15 / MS2) TaxID=1201294 RepID=I7JAQ2_METBM|nr:hypothetical protein [Methanoculleus bourgensis]CCJ37283.1 hypothetical protein BN140_2360 [Methanoculleus bourgensis MS2]
MLRYQMDPADTLERVPILPLFPPVRLSFEQDQDRGVEGRRIQPRDLGEKVLSDVVADTTAVPAATLTTNRGAHDIVVLIARALARDRKILLLDDVTSNLKIGRQIEILNLRDHCI